MATTRAVRYVKVWIELLPVDEGGRRTPLDLSTEWPVAYRPQLRVRGGHGRLLDVEFVAGPPEPIAPGARGTPFVLIEGDRWFLLYERSDLGVWLASSPSCRCTSFKSIMLMTW